MEVDVGRMDTVDAFNMHMSKGGILAHSLEDRKRDNARITRRVEELESILTPKPLLTTIVKPIEVSPTLSLRIDKTYGLL